MKEKRLSLTSLKQICNEYLIKFSENQSAPKFENRKTSRYSPCAPNLLHVLVSRMPGYHNLCSPGQSFEIDINSIIFNEVPFDIGKRCDNPSLRQWYTIVNIFKTALYALYYRRSMFDRNGNVIIKTFNHHLRAIKRTAKERRSDILDNIWFLPEKDLCYPFTRFWMKRTKKLLFTGDKTTRISVSYRTIEKDYQELKIITKDKIFQKE